MRECAFRSSVRPPPGLVALGRADPYGVATGLVYRCIRGWERLPRDQTITMCISPGLEPACFGARTVPQRRRRAQPYACDPLQFLDAQFQITVLALKRFDLLSQFTGVAILL